MEHQTDYDRLPLRSRIIAHSRGIMFLFLGVSTYQALQYNHQAHHVQTSAPIEQSGLTSSPTVLMSPQDHQVLLEASRRNQTERRQDENTATAWTVSAGYDFIVMLLMKVEDDRQLRDQAATQHQSPEGQL